MSKRRNKSLWKELLKVIKSHKKLTGGVVLLILLAIIILVGKTIYENRPASLLERPQNSVVEINIGDREGYPITLEGEDGRINFYNSSQQRLFVNLAAIEGALEFDFALSDGYFGSHNHIRNIEMHFTMEYNYAAGVDVVGDTALIYISVEAFFDMGDLPENGLSVEGSIASVMIDELTNAASANLGTIGNTLGLTETNRLNEHEREEVFSHGLRVAYGSIYNNRFMLSDIPALYGQIYVVSLSMFTMNPNYFRDNRTLQEGIQLSLVEFNNLTTLFLQEGPLIIEEDEITIWRR